MEFSYAAAPESRSIVDIASSYKHFINGDWVAGKGGTFPTINPATEEVLSKITQGSATDIDRAVKAARSAYTKIWSKLLPKERGKYLFRIARIMQERAREFAVLETLNNGKPIRESRDVDIPLAAAHFFYHAGWADKLDYAGVGKSPKPYGVVGQIIPWNFPLLMLAWKVAPALAAGNTVVLKPAESTPLTALLFAQVCQQAELPAGVVNIVTGAGETGAALVNHPGVSKIAFTGSTEVGKSIARAIADTKKVATLELGGKGANIVFEDAAIDQAVEGIVNGIFFNQGHVCCAGSRLFVQESVAGNVMRKLRDRMSTLRVGDPLDKNTDIGAINSKEQLQKIQGLVKKGIAEGGELYQANCTLPKKGFWFKPSLFTGVSSSSTVVKEEIFGPVLSVVRAGSYEEALDLVNRHEYGNGAAIFTRDGHSARDFCARVKIGMVGVNVPVPVPVAYFSFGGWKASLFGDLHAYGPESVNFYTRGKVVTSRWLDPSHGGLNLGFPTHG